MITISFYVEAWKEKHVTGYLRGERLSFTVYRNFKRLLYTVETPHPHDIMAGLMRLEQRLVAEMN